MRLLVVGLAALLLAAAPARGQPTAQRSAQEVLDASVAHSDSLRAQMSGRMRGRIDAFRDALVGTRWLGEQGLGTFSERAGMLVLRIEGFELPFVSLDRPDHWLIGTGVFTDTGTAEVHFEAPDGEPPRAMTWLDRFRFERLPDDAFAVTRDEARAIVDEAAAALLEHWVDRSRAPVAATDLMTLKRKYERATTSEEIAAWLAKDLPKLTGDPTASATFDPHGRGDEVEVDDADVRARAEDYRGGLGSVTRLQGDVGFVELQVLMDADLMAPQLGPVLDGLADARALILDVRRCRGGAPGGARLLTGLFVPDGTPLVTIEDPARGASTPIVADTPPGLSKQPQRPGYVLVAPETLGAAEELAYTLQALGKATVVGSPTAGGAHPTRRVSVHPHIALRIPSERPVVEATGSNWEGTGVIPDVEAAPADAFHAAWERATSDG